MSRRSLVSCLPLLALFALAGSSHARSFVGSPGASSASETDDQELLELDEEEFRQMLEAEDDEEEDEKAEEDEEDSDEGLRQRLTEREDRRRPLKPWSVDVAGRRLTIGGEYEIVLTGIRNFVIGEEVPEDDRLFLEQMLEIEAFYSFGPPLSIFLQGSAVMEEDLLSQTFDEISTSYLERGEMWIDSQNIAGTGLIFEVGHLDFEDERRWWWDEELDAVRLEYEYEGFDVSLALARQLFSTRSDQSHVEPENDRVLRWIVESGWELRPDHGLELFFLHQSDHSPTEEPGEIVRTDREDDFDGRLTWYGARLLGVFDLGSRGLLGYWLDTALVDGSQRVVDYDEISNRKSEVVEVGRRHLSGWAVDVGFNWIAPLAWEPRLFAGYARASEEFRQSGIFGNEAGFGGVERFNHYGFLLEPELSNLEVTTLGLGISLLRSSSLDLVYHHYRLVERADSLQDSLLEFELTGEDRRLGDEVDLVLALEEWERLEFELILSAFRTGPAFGREDGTWSYGGFFAMRFAF